MVEIEIALSAMLVYVAISLVVGDRFPFSRYSMYAGLTERKEGAVFFVRTGDRFIAADELEAVSGIDVPALDPAKVPCSQQWIVYEAQRWLENHLVEEHPEDAVPVEMGYRMLRVEADGTVSMRLEVLTKGYGRLRR
jgi:hypothetical protein